MRNGDNEFFDCLCRGNFVGFYRIYLTRPLTACNPWLLIQWTVETRGREKRQVDFFKCMMYSHSCDVWFRKFNVVTSVIGPKVIRY